jgi:hypothetical protein
MTCAESNAKLLLEAYELVGYLRQLDAMNKPQYANHALAEAVAIIEALAERIEKLEKK